MQQSALKLKEFNNRMYSKFQKMDKMKRGFITKSQLQAFFEVKTEKDEILRRELLKTLRRFNGINLDLVGFMSVVHYLVSIGAFCY
jgi:Ca2+-binding EF-hand superfamily protein